MSGADTGLLSPSAAVYGYDRTHVKRMTLLEYLHELEDEARDVRGEPPLHAVRTRPGDEPAPRQYELRRAALSSPNPAITFSSKYPTYDRLGRELCVLYQLQEAATQEEQRRLRCGDDAAGRRSGVRLSGEVAVVQDGGRTELHANWTRLSCCGSPIPSHAVRRRTRSVPAGLDLRRAASSMSRCTSGPGSEFTIYHDSVGADMTTVVRARASTVPDPSCARRRGPSPTSSCPRASSAPPCENKENAWAEGGPAVHQPMQKRSRDEGGDKGVPIAEEERPSRVHFAADPCATETPTACAAAEPCAGHDLLRLTTVRESALRTTKELFRGTVAAATPHLGRATLTLHYARPIPATAYGIHAATIPASRVSALVEHNLRSLTELGVTSVTDCTSQPCPELRCWAEVQIGTRRLRLLRFHVVAEVYDAVELSADAEDGVGAGTHMLLYRWHGHLLPFKGNETRRAALGLAFCAPAVTVSGVVFADGGVTLCALPHGLCAVPLSSVSLSLSAYTTLLKLVLKTFSVLVARRTVHGNVTAFGELFLAVAAPLTTTTSAPLVLPVHWERMTDFGMFVDRNVGRSIALDAEDAVEPSLLTIGQDLSTLLQCFLEHKLSTELTSQQHVLLQRLIIMATEPTQVANYLVQIKDLMCALPTDIPALCEACSRAVEAQQAVDGERWDGAEEQGRASCGEGEVDME